MCACGFAISLKKSEEDKKIGGAVLVKMTWKPSSLLYVANFQTVIIDKFEETVRYIYDIQKSCPLTEIDPVYFHCFPMGANEISAILSTEITEECIPRFTFSLMAFTDAKVSKLSLLVTDNLNSFYAAYSTNKLCPSQKLLPISVKSHFHCFSRLHGPANLDTCKNSLRPFSVSVYNAIEQIH